MLKKIIIILSIFLIWEATSPSCWLMASQPEPVGSYLGTHDKERVGYWLNPVGDVNGDGFDDFLSGNYHTNTNGYDAGAAYLILGRSTAAWEMDRSLQQADAKFIGESQYEALGYHVGGGGDVNGDGLDDILIGAPSGNETGKDRPGTAYIIFGRAAADWGNDFVPYNSADASFDGETDFDQAGKAVAIVGDLNNDGFADMVVGAPYYDQSAEDGGKVYIILGKSSGWSTNVDISQSDASYRCFEEEALAGYMVAGPGDVNGDGLDDILVGAYGWGKAFLILGRSSANWGHNRDIESADVIFEAENRTDDVGWIVAGAGDVNNDGYDDCIITSSYNNDGGAEAGKTYLVFGRSSWSSTIELANADASFLGEAAHDNAGWSASGVGDINGDNFDDFMIGAWYNDQAGADAGKAYILYGKSSGWQTNVNLSTVEDYILGETNVNYMGFSVAAAGDANNDGMPDYIVSAPYSDEAFEWGGQVYLFLGERPKYPVSGKVSYYDNAEPVPGATVAFEGTSTGNVLTDESGNYEIMVPDGRDVTFSVQKEKGSDQNFMTILSYDAALISRYVVDLEIFSEDQQKAADVDADGSVTTYDASLIARHVVALEPPAESHVAEWIFEPEERHYLEMSSALVDQDYTGIIRGNVHGNWTPGNGLLKMSNQAAFSLAGLPKTAIANEIITLPIAVPKDVDFLALDLELQYDPRSLRFEEIKRSGLFDDFHLRYSEDSGILRVSLFGASPVKYQENALAIIFKVQEQIESRTSISINKLVVNDQPGLAETAVLELNYGGSHPKSFSLKQNYPNPFNPATMIMYEVSPGAHISIKVLNLMGQEVATLVDRFQAAGAYSVNWNGKNQAGRDVASGIYICRAKQGEQVQYLRMLKMQ